MMRKSNRLSVVFLKTYSWVPNRRRGLEQTGGLKFLKIDSRVGVDEILFDTLKSNTKRPKCLGCFNFSKTTNFWIKCILLDINIIVNKTKQWGQNETKGTKDQK